jgi:hypothetical protein
MSRRKGSLWLTGWAALVAACQGDVAPEQSKGKAGVPAALTSNSGPVVAARNVGDVASPTDPSVLQPVRPHVRPVFGWERPAGSAPPDRKPDGVEPATPPAFPPALAARYQAYRAELARRGIGAPGQDRQTALAAAAALKAQMIPPTASYGAQP